MPNTEKIWLFITTQGADFGLKVIGAIAVWIVGRWLIRMAQRLAGKALERSKSMDKTLTSYISSILGVLLNIVLIVSIMDLFGVQTTSFAALLAGAGLAIGTAWGGLLQHFAAGVFLQVMRPYRVGDAITAAGVTGTVKQLGLFGTTIVTGENVLALVGNNKVLSDTIQNYSTLPFRRLAVRPYTHNSHYGQVLFDTHRAIVRVFGKAGYPTPETPVAQRTVGSPAAAQA